MNQSTKLGLGCVTFGREIDETTAFAMMDYAYANGITSFDTAAAYAGGASERLIGEWMAKNPAKLVQVATKIIPPFDPPTIKANITLSLQRLKVDQIDVLYLHRWDDHLNNLEPWLVLEKLVYEGKVKEIGVSNFSFQQLEQTIQLLQQHTSIQLSYLQNNHNLAVSDLTDPLIELCQNNRIKIITFSPLGAGFLTGKHCNGVAVGSRFDIMPAHQAIYFNDNAQKRLHNLLAVANFAGHEPALLALAWAIHQPQTHQVLVGGRSVEQLSLAIAAAKFDDDSLLEMLGG
jgi:aryl-alcohol dehydrogenase-like predicted oxidoreductase